jgi:hypothetical protein
MNTANRRLLLQWILRLIAIHSICFGLTLIIFPVWPAHYHDSPVGGSWSDDGTGYFGFIQMLYQVNINTSLHSLIIKGASGFIGWYLLELVREQFTIFAIA